MYKLPTAKTPKEVIEILVKLYPATIDFLFSSSFFHYDSGGYYEKTLPTKSDLVDYDRAPKDILWGEFLSLADKPFCCLVKGEKVCRYGVVLGVEIVFDKEPDELNSHYRIGFLKEVSDAQHMPPYTDILFHKEDL